ncbi:DNA-binding response regulator, OmpR family, contains REC and winged-helix (wHTH) domain [Evansella caseinilytica]|uniref:DNA-binding response regulator, OmpR family, contains REC and winged-helix (WHTH) domain n=1 Tax=Evansella caseinilytica TaxID=1503961 RepID=A0A1H3GJ39_9BACI|nr:response regulator transcription factor [Evansella caseinilytica]SDY02668.1 DNA-binding response regulator, OmpR family, contains REC and winged-helix (wHTH) domain [Evansella caseinilytica]
MKEKILIVDDECEIVQFIKDALTDEGYEVMTAFHGDQVFKLLGGNPDLIILDVMMPGMDGWEVCRAIRGIVSCPILFLSARQSEEDRIKGLMVGGDDYMLKPFSVKEMKARIRAHLRREQRNSTGKIRPLIHYGELTLDAGSYQLYIREHLVPLTVREFEIVQFLLIHPNQVFTREQIYEKVWGFDAEGDSATVTEHIKKIRTKLGELTPDKTYIATVWGVGYKWDGGRL